MNESTDTEPIPDYLYFKFRKINKHLIESLVNSSLYFAKRDRLNDPFDCQLDLHKSWARAALSVTGKRKEWLQSTLDNPIFLNRFSSGLEEVGVCSFSLGLDKPLSTSVLWSHYADEHRGVSLLYRFPAAFLLDSKNKILGVDTLKYGHDVLMEWLKDAPMELGNFLDGLLKIYLTAKSPAWEYEKEARIIRLEHGLFNIPREFLEQVCFGLLTPPTDIELVEKLAREYCGCKKFCRIIRDEKSDFGIRAVEM